MFFKISIIVPIKKIIAIFTVLHLIISAEREVKDSRQERPKVAFWGTRLGTQSL